MSESVSQDPETLGSGYGLAANYPPTPATPSSTVQDPPGSNLPPFSTFAADMDTTSGFGSDRFLSDTRLLDISNWDYYTETRLLERHENGLAIITSQPQYRPWESKPVDSTSQHGFASTPVTTFADAFVQNGVSKLPSFQSQFQSYNEPVTTSETTLTTLTNLTPLSPNSSSPSLTTLNSNFHTLSAVNPRNYPLVPAPIQAREIPSIQQQFLDERHIQLYTHPTANITTLNAAGGIFQSQNGTLIQNSQLLGSPTVVTVIKSEPDLKLTSNLAALTPQDTGLKIQNLHPTQFQNPMPTMLDNGLYNGLDKKLNGINATANSPTRNDFRKKERRKMRASSLESSAESDGASSNMDMGSESSGQVAAVSSTASFKTHHGMMPANSLDVDLEISGVNEGKQVKKKRKRCGECIGCQRKDNCGDCAPCRNDKSHQICKQRRCEKLTEKKNLYGDQTFMRGESRRGRGKGRGAGSYRGRKAAAPVSLSTTSVPEASVPSSRPSPQPVHMLKQEQTVQQQPMAPMPFYADPTRFTAPVWQAEPAQTWPQGQFIQQIAPPAQTTLEAYPQQYPNGIYQTTYQQPGFETNTFYTGAVQVLTSTRPPSVTEHPQLTPRTNGSYSHTPSPVPQQQPPQQPSTPRSNISGQYHQEYVNNQNYGAPSTPTGGVDNQSRPSSVNSVVNAPVSNHNFQSQSQTNGSTFTSVSSTNFSPGSNTNPSYVNANSGNEKPGYPQVNSNPQLVSHSSSGYPGSEYGGSMQQQQEQQTHWQIGNENMMWEPHIAQNSEPTKANHEESHYRNNTPHHQEQLQENENQCGDQFSQSNRIELNSRIKSMILNKHQSADRKMEDSQGENENKTGHFLWYSHHRRPPELITELTGGGGGVPQVEARNNGIYLPPTIHTQHRLPNENAQFIHCQDIKQEITKEELPIFENQENNIQKLNQSHLIGNTDNRALTLDSMVQGDKKLNVDLDKKGLSTDLPLCNCFPPDKLPPEPGNYYTHLGCSNSLVNLRKDFEDRIGANGKAIRIEKVRYTGKEGKTPQGCPLAKWIIRRSNYDEKYLIVVKHRQGHVCISAYIVICIVAWEGVNQPDADGLYSSLTEKLNKFGLPTTRRCATNEQRTCACQGLDPKTCGASFSFGCSWSMYYNGCKFARSKIVRKFRLTERSEEENIETRLQNLTTSITPLYQTLAPESFKNQCLHEKEAGECRLGLKEGKPFSGVTACMDFCAHAHKDSHNMNDGCTAVVTLTKDRSLNKHEDEQLHVLPLYTIESTDEFGSKENQDTKYKNGSIEMLNRYECEVRIRTVPLQPCRRRKKKEEDNQHIAPPKKDSISSRSSTSSGYESSRSQTPHTPIKNDPVLQSNHVSSSNLDSSCTPPPWISNGFGNYPPQQVYEENPWFQKNLLNANHLSGGLYNNPKSTVLIPNNSNTAFNVTYPKHESVNRFEISQSAQSNYTQNKVQDSHSGIRNNNHSLINATFTTTTPINIIDYSTGIVNTNRHHGFSSSVISHNMKNNGYNFSSTPIKSPTVYPFKMPQISASPIHHINNFNHYPPSNGFHSTNGLIENNIAHNLSHGLDHNLNSIPRAINPQFYNMYPNSINTPVHFNLRQPHAWYDQSKDINKNYYYKPPFSYSYPPGPPLPFQINQNINPNTYHLNNPFDDISDFNKRLYPFPTSQPLNEDASFQPTKPNWDLKPLIPEPAESLGKVIDIIDNADSFLDSQIGGVAIALTHGSVLFECAKHELHSTTALKKPNRLNPTRISLVFYQHRNLNKPKHGWDQWEEKTRLKKLGLDQSQKSIELEANLKRENDEVLIHAPALSSMSVTTLFPMYPCIVSGSYQGTQSF